MVKKYYVNINAQYNGDHEVHDESCIFLPAVQNRIYLGNFYSCTAAITEARRFYAQADGCKTCSPDCHTR